MFKFKVSGMTCGHCEKSVEKAVSQVLGVEEVLKVSREEQVVEVKGSPDPEAVKDAIREEGYEVEEIRG